MFVMSIYIYLVINFFNFISSLKENPNFLRFCQNLLVAFAGILIVISVTYTLHLFFCSKTLLNDVLKALVPIPSKGCLKISSIKSATFSCILRFSFRQELYSENAF